MNARARQLGWLMLGSACALGAAPVEGATAAGDAEQAGKLPRLAAMAAADLRVTSGSIAPEGATRFGVQCPVLRAELGVRPRSAVEIEFTYRGPTAEAAPLASGELRRQIGLKLRAQDTCNTIYVMWHIAPDHGLEVSVKSNAGQSQHAQCGDRGYTFVKPKTSRPLAAIREGDRHVLRATLTGSNLAVQVDGALSWSGTLPPAALGFDGPVGLRSDNGVFDVELRAAALSPN